MTVILTGSLPSVKKVNIALGEPCDFDQPVGLAGTDERAKLVDIARRYAWIDANSASGASEGIAVYNLGDCDATRAKCQWDSKGKWQE